MKRRKGLAAMSPEKRAAISRKGGIAKAQGRADPQSRIDEAVRLLDHYGSQHAYGDAVLFAKATLLGVPVDTLIDPGTSG